MKFLQKQKEKINNEKVIFHGRLEGNLKEIKPHKCKHDKAYVYASHNIALCIIFGVKRTGENIDFGLTKLGKTYVAEFYEGALEDRFKNRTCYLYKLPEKYFELKTEHFERVSENPVPVLECVEIKDSYEYLLQLEKEKKIIIRRYKSLSKKQKRINKEILTKRIKQYLNFKEITNSQYNKLNKEDKLQYDINLQRKNFTLKKFKTLTEQIKKEINIQ